MRIKKQSIILSIIIAMIFLASFSALGITPKVYDEAALFTSSEKESMEKTSIDLSEKLRLDIVVVTIADNNGKTSRQYADDFYDYNGFGYGEDADGLLLLINMEDREVYIATTGLAIRYFTDDRLDSIIDKMYNHLTVGNYNTAVDTFFTEVEYYYNMGIPSNQYTQKEDGIAKRIILSLLISLIIGGISVGIMAINNKGKVSTDESTYLSNNSIDIINKYDRLVNTRVTHVIIQTNDNKPSASKGRSTIHRSSSGRSHGGRGRKF